MINRATLDRLEDAIDHFEEEWSPESRSQIEALLDQFGLREDVEAIVELIRIDIELRYERGQSIELDDYLARFRILEDRPDRIAEIAFEDFRSRAANGFSVVPSRWSGLPGVHQELWFQNLSLEVAAERGSEARSGFAGFAERGRSDPRRLFEGVTRSPDEAGEGLELPLASALDEAGFHLVQKIGEGAFSQVFLANQHELADRFVVLKIVDESLTEPEYLARLQHTNIVPIYSFHRILSRSVICMPYTGSVTLDDFLRRESNTESRNGESLAETVLGRFEDTTLLSEEPGSQTVALGLVADSSSSEADAPALPMDRLRSLSCSDLAIWVFERLASALSHAHARGVLHNDLKPSNVLIRNDGEPALLDFNLSQSLSEKTLRRVGGTLPYMAPETLRAMMGLQTRPEAASDLYALGVMMFQFVTGRLPYPVPNSLAEVDLAAGVEARRHPPDWRESDRLNPALRAIINRCLAFDSANRYASADDLQQDLQREQQRLPLAHASEPVTWKTKKWTRRHPRAITWGLVAFFFVAVVLPVALTSMKSARANRALRTAATYRAFSNDSSEYLSRLMTDPNRQRDNNIRRGVAVLEQYELLDRESVERLLSHAESEDREQPIRDNLLRHVVHLAILETQHLSRMRLSDPDAAKDVRRLDQLIRVAKWVDGETSSRARLFLESERARLTGNEKRHEVLAEAAEAIRPENDSELYLEAVRLLAEDDYRGASDLLSALADRESIPSALRWTMLGRAQYSNRRLEDAKLSFTQSLTRAPGSAKLHVLKGRCHLELKQNEFAEQDFLKAIELDPNSLGAWSQLGLSHHARKNYSEALRCYNRALEIAPGRFWTLLKRARTYRAMGKEELADADYRQVMESECDDANELVNRARARRELEPEAALEDLRQSHRLDPDRMYTLHESGRILAVELERHEEAIEFYDQVLEAQPLNKIARIDRALSLVRLGQTARALRDTQQAMQEPTTGKTTYQAACVHALVDAPLNQQRALTLLAQAIHKGYVPKSLERDPDLESIRDREEFRVISRFLRTSQRGRRRGPPNAPQDDPMADLPPL